MFGLDDRVKDAVLGVFKNFPAIEEAKIFGSRALGSFRAKSDVDIVLFGQCEDDMNLRVAAELDALSTPYQFDVVCYDQIQNDALRDHIDRVGKTLYEKS